MSIIKKNKLYIKHAQLQAGLRQVSGYYVEPDKKSTSTEPGTSNAVIINWKKKRIEELTEELKDLESLMGEEE